MLVSQFQQNHVLKCMYSAVLSLSCHNCGDQKMQVFYAIHVNKLTAMFSHHLLPSVLQCLESHWQSYSDHYHCSRNYHFLKFSIKFIFGGMKAYHTGFPAVWTFKIPCVFPDFSKISIFPVFSLSGKTVIHFPCFPCVLGTLLHADYQPKDHKYITLKQATHSTRLGKSRQGEKIYWCHKCQRRHVQSQMVMKA